MAAAASWMTQKSGVQAVFGPVPDGVEVSRRVYDGKSIFVLINFSATDQQVTLPRAMKSLFDAQDVTTIRLPQYGVAILRDQR